MSVLFRQCKKCEKWKNASDFPKDQLRCKSCTSIYMKNWADKNRNKINNNQRLYQTTIKGRASVLLNAAIKRAKLDNQEFKLTLQNVIDGISSRYCQKTFFPFDFELRERGTNKYKMNPFAPSIDKIDPFGIYEPQNVQYVCTWYNLAKGQMTEQDLIMFCKRVVVLNP